MNGGELLARIRERSPATVRVMLTGYADSDSILRALPSIHQLFTKPCPPSDLRALLERCRDLDTLAGDATVLATVGGLDRLPSAPVAYRELEAVIDGGRATVREVAAVVENDPACAARVLRLANCSYFGDGTTIHSIERAIACLGKERLRYLVLGASLTELEQSGPINEIQRTASQTAAMVRTMITDPAELDVAVAAALLNDVGCAVLRMRLGHAYDRLVELARDTRRSIADIEREHLGVSHADVGACLLRIWGLPSAIVDVVRHHHDPGSAPAPLRMIAAAVHVADASVRQVPIDHASLERSGYAGSLEAWLGPRV
jgi:HD-like signal output (HDOD) protein